MTTKSQLIHQHSSLVHFCPRLNTLRLRTLLYSFALSSLASSQKMGAPISSGYITTNYTCFPCSAITHLLAQALICLLTFFANSLLLVRSLTHLQAHSVARSLICMLTQLHPHPFARSLIHLLICLLTNSFAFLLAVSVARSLNHLLTLCSLTHCLLTRF